MTKPIEIGWYGPTHDCWGWILEHFRDVAVLREQDVAEWIFNHPTSRDLDNVKTTASLIFASEHRTDTAIDLIRSLDLKDANATVTTSPSSIPWCLVLGTDWSGHRRTQPLPESWNTYYWYELYDRLLPWLGQLEYAKEYNTKQTVETTAPAQGRKPSVRVQRWIDSVTNRKISRTSQASRPAIALVVVDQAETKQLWVDALGRHQIQTVCAAPDRTDFWIEPDWIVIDLARSPLKKGVHVGENSTGDNYLEASLVRLAAQFPESIKVVVDAFPRWHTWSVLQSKGADLVVAKPYDIEGLFDTLKLIG